MSEHARTLTPEQRAIAAYRWLTTQAIADEMGTTRGTVINMIQAGEFGLGNVTRWGREYRIKPEAFAALKERKAQEVDKEMGVAS